ncbi:MAG: sigma-70 family RNA polymerase sigma factor [Bacteroidales bacterium]|nr:sigma-70 family RNA polymerase sigma factor [Bacteroidales bacterium]
MEGEYTQLVADCRRRDRRAMRKLYEAAAPMALGVCMRYCHNREDAQDVMQEGFVKAFERLKELRDPERLMQWIYKLMVNECLLHLRSKCPEGLMEDMGMEPVTLPVDPFANEEIVLAIQRLTPSQRAVFNLVDVEGYTSEEAAEALGVQRNNVMSTLSKARAALRTLLTEKR